MFVQSIHRNARSRVKVNRIFNDEFLVQVGLHQGSLLNTLLFIIVLQTLSRKIRSGCPEELVYDGDLTLVSETLASLKGRLEAWREALESYGLMKDLKKTN